jgi:energy-coupling factor transporter ATP-binding protein EcfA2
VLVCDEPTANLDASARRAFFDEIAASWQGKVILLCSHRAEEVSGFVERVIELRDGRVVSDDCRGGPVHTTWSLLQ